MKPVGQRHKQCKMTVCQYFHDSWTGELKLTKTRFLFTQNTATIRRASAFKSKLYTPELEAREQFERDYKIRKFEMIKQGKKREILTKIIKYCEKKRQILKSAQ